LTTQPQDAELKRLLVAIAQGDEAAMAVFYDLTCAKVFGLVRFMLMDEGLAEEVVLDVFWQVWQEAGRYQEGKAGPWAWLMMMARSRAIDRLRSLKKHQEDCDIEAMAEELADAGAGPEDLVADSETCHQVRACIARLPLAERQKLTLAFFKGLSQSEIAEYCAMPLGTVKSHIRNGMARLGELLEQQLGKSLHETL
jgi:RNA polymerase sigma-70 factor (ECF subfamily)